jgi:CheY-like chemotaxis protein
MANFLIADDSGVMRAILQFMIEKCGHRVVAQAKDGEDAVLQCRGQNPDAVALDAIMKGADGLSAMLEIKKMNSAVKTFILVEAGQTNEEQQARQSGANGILQKPFDLNKVSEEIKRVMG